MRASDPRTGYPESDIVPIVAGDGDTPQTVVDIPSDGLFRPTQVKVEYDDSASVAVTLSLFDDADGTASADVEDLRDRFRNIQPGETRAVDDLDMREFEEDVLAQTDGNQDGPLDVTVYGELITGLADVMGGS